MNPENPNFEKEFVENIVKNVLGEITVYRDAKDVSDLRFYRVVVGFLAIALVFMAVVTGLLFLRKPDIITALTTPDGRRVVAINNRDFGCGEPVELGKDNLTNDDKTYLVNQFSTWIYGVYLPSREKDVQKALMLIDDKKFLKAYADQLASGQLQTEKVEQWSAVWKSQKISVDESNPQVVRLIGVQELTKVVNNVQQTKQTQLQLTFKLTTDGSRHDSNLRSGFRILAFTSEELAQNNS